MTNFYNFSRQAVSIIGALCIGTVLILAATPILPIA